MTAVLSRETDARGRCTPVRRARTRVGCCVVPNSPPPDTPDSAIYSQVEQISKGVIPTWDSPDILTHRPHSTLGYVPPATFGSRSGASSLAPLREPPHQRCKTSGSRSKCYEVWGQRTRSEVCSMAEAASYGTVRRWPLRGPLPQAPSLAEK